MSDHDRRGLPLRAGVRLFPAGKRPARVHLTEFLSSNLRVSCVLAVFDAACVAVGKGGSQYAADAEVGGHVPTCRPPRECFQQLIPRTPLVDGNRVKPTASGAGPCATASGVSAGAAPERAAASS